MKIPIQLLLFVLAVVVTLVLTEIYQRGREVSYVHVQIRNAAQNPQDTSHFLTEDELLKLVHDSASVDISQLKVKEIDTKKIENAIKTNTFVSNCEVSLDAKGVLHIDVEEQKPLARILTASPSKGAYITASGKLAPLSRNFTARVILISTENEKNTPLLDTAFWKTADGTLFLEALTKIDNQPFWKAQLTQIEIAKNGDWIAYPQVGEQRIELGKPTDMDNKLMRLQQFYEKVIPKKGWGNYKFVSVKYDNQLVCR